MMADHKEEKPPKCVSLGMVIVDEIRSPGKEPLLDIPGGSGAFATFGARLVAGRKRAGEVGCLLHVGEDFPSSVLHIFKSWQINLSVNTDAKKESTRGLLEYHDVSFSRKTFRYTTTPLQPVPKDLPPNLLLSRAYHILGGPAYIEDHATELSYQKYSVIKSKVKPLLLWEPLPIQVSAEAKDAHIAACKHVDVFSPNHLELMTLFQGPVSEADADDSHFDRQKIEEYADKFLDAGIGHNRAGSIVVRAGSHGCLVASLKLEGRFRWLPAFSFSAITRRIIVDATGAGNTFLGAMTFALADGKGVVEAAKFGNVAASFALQQIGLANLEVEHDGQDETWNGETFGDRFKEYINLL